MIVVDTNVFIEILQGTAFGDKAIGMMEEADPDEKFAYSAITWFELCARPQQTESARRLLAAFEALPLTLPIAEKAAEIFHKHLSGNRRHVPDALIAATAITAGAALWTINRSDFKRIPRLKLLP